MIELKNGWALTDLAPDSEQPNLFAGSFCRSWKKKKIMIQHYVTIYKREDNALNN